MKMHGDTMAFADSSVIARTEYYQSGVTLPSSTVAMQEQEYVLSNDNSIVGGVAVMFVVLVLMLLVQRSSYPHRMKEFFSNKRLYIEDGSSEDGGAIGTLLLTSISALCLTLIFFNDMASLHGFDTAVGIPYWIIAVGYVACMFVAYAKSVLYGIVNWIFFSRKEGKRWMSGYFFATSLTALPLYLAMLLYLFCPSGRNLVTASVIFIGMVYELLLLYKLFVNFKIKEYGYLPLFLYFCSVEVMPAVVIWHTFDWINNFFIVKNLIY